MAFTWKSRFLGNAFGDGGERNCVGFSTITTPTQVNGPTRQVVASAGTAAKIGSMISGQVKGMFVEAIVSGVYINPFTLTSDIASCGCYISQGDWNYYSFKTATSVLPSFSPESSRAEVDVWVFGIS